MAVPLLDMRHITKKFPGVLALDDVSISASVGEILAIVGENGAGKSTLMKILSGLYPSSAYEGEIYLNGEKVSFSGPADAKAAGIGMIYQEINTHLDLSITENLFMGEWIRKRSGRIDWTAMHCQAREILKAVGMDINPRIRMRRLTASQQQQVCIASVLTSEPKILVLDEPTSALTEKEAEHLFDTMKVLKSQGITCLLISHKLNEIFENADAIVVLRDGRVVDNFLDKSKFSHTKTVQAMVGRDVSQYYPDRKRVIGEVLLTAENFTVPHSHNKNKDIISDVSFTLHEGEILGIGGLLGSGRSELVNAIFGKIAKSSGTVKLYGEEIDTTTPFNSIANGLALVTEDRKVDGFVGLMSIKENITLASLDAISKLGHLLKPSEVSYSNDFFSSLKIKAPSINTKLNTLSGGNQQKVVLSKWLMTKPKVLILDEPTRGIDVGTKHEIYEIMNDLTQEGIAIIMISSELQELISMSDNILVLSGGRAVKTLPAKEVNQEIIMYHATRFTKEVEESLSDSEINEECPQ